MYFTLIIGHIENLQYHNNMIQIFQRHVTYKTKHIECQVCKIATIGIKRAEPVIFHSKPEYTILF